MDRGNRELRTNDTKKIISHQESEKYNKYFLYQRTGGLGDMLLGLYFVWAYSFKHDRKVIVDWRGSTYLRSKENLFSVLFNKKFKILEVEIEEYDPEFEYPEPFYPNFINNQFVRNNWDYQEFLDKNGKFCIDENNEYKSYHNFKKIFYPIMGCCGVKEPTIHTGRQISLVPIFPTKIPLLTYLFFNELLFNYKQDVKDLIENKKRIFDGKRVIGIHIRNGNGMPFYYDFEKEIYYVTDNLEEYLDRNIGKIIESNEDCYFFICSDSEEVIKILKRKQIERVIFIDREIVEKGSEPHHIHWMENPHRIMLDAFVEMNLLSYCEKVYGVGSHMSSFSFFSKFANKRPEYIRIGCE